MENVGKNAVIINCGLGNWYGDGSKRLERSLNYVGWAGNTIIYADEQPPNNIDHIHIPYYMKIATFEESIKRGYSHILWLDSSFWAIKNPMKMFDIINEQGYYFFSTGYNLAQSVNDATLEFCNRSRDDAENQTEWASGCLGINLNNEVGKKLYERWKYYMDSGLSRGSREHDNQSQDPRFRFHRQDQSCLNMAIWDLELKNDKGTDMIAYFGTGHNEKELIFFIGGL